MTIKAIILNVCDSFLKPKFLLKYVLTYPKCRVAWLDTDAAFLGIQKQVLSLNSN